MYVPGRNHVETHFVASSTLGEPESAKPQAVEVPVTVQFSLMANGFRALLQEDLFATSCGKLIDPLVVKDSFLRGSPNFSQKVSTRSPALLILVAKSALLLAVPNEVHGLTAAEYAGTDGCQIHFAP